MVNRAEELIADLEAEIFKRNARIEDLEAQLEDTESRRANAARNASAFEARMGDLQVENGKLQDRLARYVRFESLYAESERELAALKSQQPSAGVVLPEQEGSAAQKSFWAGFEACACGLSGMNIRAAWNEFKSSEQFARLNPLPRAQAVPDGYVMVPVHMTDEMRDAGNVYTLNRSTLNCIWRDVLAAAPSAQQKESE